MYSCIPKFPQKYVPACLGQSSSSCQYVLCVIIGVSDHDLLIGDGVCLKVKNGVQLRDGGIVGDTMWYCSGTCGHATVCETVNFTKAILRSIENWSKCGNVDYRTTNFQNTRENCRWAWHCEWMIISPEWPLADCDVLGWTGIVVHPMYTCYGCKEDRLAFQPGSSRWHAFALPLLALDTSKSIAFFWRTITPQMRARIRDSMNSHQALDSNDFNWNTWHVRGHSRTSWQHDTTKDLEELPLARATTVVLVLVVLGN